LLEPIYDADGKELKGYRPLGGGVEFQEKAAFGLKREIMEELSEDIIIKNRFMATEELFTYGGKSAHEIALIYECSFVNKSLYQHDKIVRTDTLHGIPIHAEWLDPFNLPDGLPLFPNDLFNKLKQDQK
jgi:hypothetical protein